MVPKWRKKIFFKIIVGRRKKKKKNETLLNIFYEHIFSFSLKYFQHENHMVLNKKESLRIVFKITQTRWNEHKTIKSFT